MNNRVLVFLALFLVAVSVGAGVASVIVMGAAAGTRVITTADAAASPTSTPSTTSTAATTSTTSLERDFYDGLEDLPAHFRVCMDDDRGGYVCTEDPVGTRRFADTVKIQRGYLSERMHMGIPQRVDGTEAEQEAIKDVIRLMNEYFYGEVLAKPAYKDVRYKCRNYYELCAFWSAIGECETNRLFMVPHCAAACRLCLLHNSGIGVRKDEYNEFK